jgi:hydrophobe/amphiphile efflux-1 (HAE1) family protein
MRLTRTTLARPVAVTVLSIAVAVVGLYGLFTLPVDYLPEITYPMVKIHAYWRGATPEEIDTNVADPLERVMATVDRLDYLESTITEGMYTLLVNFRYGANVDVAYQDVMAAYGRVARQLPADMDPPIIFKADPSQLPVLELTLSSSERSLTWLREWADNWLQDRLVTVNGTAGVEIVGGLKREIRVHLDPLRLQALGLTPAAVGTSLELANLETFAGRVIVESREIIARTMGEFENLDEIRDVVVARGPEGRLVYLRDVATVEDSHEEVRVVTRFDGDPCVKLAVLKQADANTVEVSRAVARRVAELREIVPPDIEFGVVENQADYIMAAIASVRDAALIAAALVILVVYLFLGRVRQVAVMLIALPLAVLANFFVMRMAGFSLNIFSLGGLVVAMGVVIDNSIVVIENITRVAARGEGEHAASVGAEQVSTAILAATLTFMSLFLPFLMVPGLASLLFRELILVVAGILLLSLLVALTVTPAAARWLRVGEGQRRQSTRVDRAVERLAWWYRGALSRLLPFSVWVVVATMAMFAATFFLLGRVGSEFLPKLDDGRVMVKVLMPAGTAVTEVDRVLADVERVLEGMPEVASVFTMAGGRVWGLATLEIPYEGEVDVLLVPKSQRRLSTADFVAKVKPLVQKVSAPGGRLNVVQMKTKGIRQVGTQEVEVRVKGDDIPTIFAFARQAAEAMRASPGLGNVNVSMSISKPEYRVFVDRDRASALGVSIQEVALTLRNLVRGEVATRYREGSEYYPIRVMIPETQMAGKEDLERLVIADRGGTSIALRDLATVERAVGPVEIVREDQAKEVIVRADSAGVSVGEATTQAAAVVGALDLPAGVEVALGGQAQMMRENRRSMGLILGFALFFAYVVLAVQFESFVQPLLIMIRVPLSLIGIVAALLLTGFPVGVTVLIGVIILAGNEVNHGVVLVEFVNQLRAEGRALRDAVLDASAIRMRPILMTLTTSVLGLLPLALGIGEGGDMLVPMAVAVIGGLIFSLFMTLVFLPCAYLIAPGHRRATAALAGTDARSDSSR